MLKKIREKRIQFFKKSFPDYKISDKGNYWVKIGASVENKRIIYTGRSVTKNTIDKLGTINEFTKSEGGVVFVLKPTGALKCRVGGQWRNLSLKLIDNHFVSESYKGIIDLFFIGRKYEWMKDYRRLWKYRFFQSFNSLKEAKNFLGFDFINNKDFYQLFSDNWYTHELDTFILAENKKNTVRLLKKSDTKTRQILDDYIHLAYEHNETVLIPAGKNKLVELHDDLVHKINIKSADDYSKEQKYYPVGNKMFEQEWEKRGLKFKRLNTPYEMYQEGLSQRHCLGTNYYNSLGSQSFYVFWWKEDKYDLQLYKSGSLGQFYGYKNIDSAPKELIELVTKDLDLSHSIEDKKPNLDDYPKINDSKTNAPALAVEEADWPF